MASEAERGEIEIEKMKSNDKESADDVVVVVSIDLPAPDGWAKKFTPKQGGTPRRNEIVFISPTGEEIKNKRQLDLYLKSHPGGPSVSEFDWGTGDTPRRSARIKSKATESPETEPAKKMPKKSSSTKKGKKAKDDDIDGEAEPEEDKDVAPEETKGSAEVEMKDAEDAGDHDKAEVTAEETLTDKIEAAKDPVNESEMKIDEKPENPKTSNGANSGKKEDDEKSVAAEETNESADVKMENADGVGDRDEAEVATDDADTGKVDTVNDPLPESEITDEKPENPEKISEATSGENEENDGDNSMVIPGLEEEIKKEAEKEQSEPEAPSQVQNETDAEVKKASEAVKVGEEDKEATTTTTTTTTTTNTTTIEQASNVEVVVKSDSEVLKMDPEVGKSTQNDQDHPPSHVPKASEVS